MAKQRALVAVLLLPLAVARFAPACTENGATCAPGDYEYCACPSKTPGYALCSNDGRGYGACDCSGAIPAGAGVLVEAGSPVDAGPATTDGAFLSSCSDNAQCASGLCFAFNAYGPHCSQPCTKDTDCPAPSPGCSNNKICKLH